MNTPVLVLGFVLFLVGLVFLIFNKRIGLFFYNNEPEIANYLYPWNSRVHILIFGTILTVAGIFAVIDQIMY